MDALIRLRPKWKNFRIQDSDKFLAACFSLSFGVMVSLQTEPERRKSHTDNIVAAFVSISRHVALVD